jgi:hypothetical protein
MYYKLICILYALLCGQNFILVKSRCYTDGDGFLRFGLKTSGDVFSQFGLKTGGLGFLV